MNAMPLFSYPDQLLRDIWVPWCENILFNEGSTDYLTPRGFQDKVGATSSTERTRAKEIYILGFLKGEIVNDRGGSRRVTPLGWELTYRGEGVISRLGYLSYVIGKALIKLEAESITDNECIQKALSSICALMLLQSGFQYNGKFTLTSSLFSYILQAFQQPITIGINEWLRYVAAAMFCTLDDSRHGETLLRKYFANEPCEELYFIKESGRKKCVTPDNMFNCIDAQYSLTDIKKTKASLFFIGDPREGRLRGLYSQALFSGGSILDQASKIERTAYAAHEESPFAAVCTREPGRMVECVITKLQQIFTKSTDGLNSWRELMANLEEGVKESLKYISQNVTAKKGRLYYIHEPSEICDAREINFEVLQQRCSPGLVKEDEVIYNDKQFKIEDIRKRGDNVILKARRIS